MQIKFVYKTEKVRTLLSLIIYCKCSTRSTPVPRYDAVIFCKTGLYIYKYF